MKINASPVEMRRIAKTVDVTPQIARLFIESMWEEVVEIVKKGGSVCIHGLGTFALHDENRRVLLTAEEVKNAKHKGIWYRPTQSFASECFYSWCKKKYQLKDSPLRERNKRKNEKRKAKLPPKPIAKEKVWD